MRGSHSRKEAVRKGGLLLFPLEKSALRGYTAGMRAIPLALLLAAPASAGVVSVPGDLVAPLSSASILPVYNQIATLLPSGPMGAGGRVQLAAYLDAGDYARVNTYFRDRLLPAFQQKQPITVKALERIAPNSARFQATELGKMKAAFDKIKIPDSNPVQELNAQLKKMEQAEDPAEMGASIDALFDGIRRKRQAGEISELYARFVLGEAAKPVNDSEFDPAKKKALNARLGAEMGTYSSEPPALK